MSLRVLVVPDKFKGTLTSAEAGRHISEGWRRSRPEDSLSVLPMSDGGDGFGEVLGDLLGAERVLCETVDAAGRPRTAAWWWHQGKRIAVIESAQVVGLALLPPAQHHPFLLDTRGLAAVIQAAAGREVDSILMGVGGSATNDGGFGLARALGWRFLAPCGEDIAQWTSLDQAVTVRAPSPGGFAGGVTVAVDVGNPLLGPEGATRIYGPQKGLRADDFGRAEASLARLAELMAAYRGEDASLQPGAGAAGGLGFGLMAFLEARTEGGFDLYARTARLEDRIQEADLVITGEGCMDRSTLMGKGVGGVARLCRSADVPCIGLAGILGAGLTALGSGPFAEIRAIAPEWTTPELARSQAGHWLGVLAGSVASRVRRGERGGQGGVVIGPEVR
jgi:glycerate kinase